MSKRLSPAAIQALKEALSSIYWYKSDLRSFLQNSIGDRRLVSSLDWNAYKRQIVSDLIDELCADHDGNLAALTRLCYDVTEMQSFPHLEQVEGGKQKQQRPGMQLNSYGSWLKPIRRLSAKIKPSENDKKTIRNESVRAQQFVTN